MTLSEKLQTIAQNEERVYTAGMRIGEDTGREYGYADGLAEGEHRCAQKHFFAVVEGDGTSTLSVPIPFEPDTLTVWGADPRSLNSGTAIAYLSADLTSFAYIAAVFGLFNNRSAITTTPMTAKGFADRYNYTDGVVSVFNLKSAASNPESVFPQGVPYVVCAGKFAEGTMRSRIIDYVRSLTGSGTASMSKLKIEAVFTNAEWEALIAEKPNWTFTLS